MSAQHVSEIAVGGSDAAGSSISFVYSKLTPHYAVYCTDERVMVQFSDDPAEDAAQRKLLAAVNPLRGQVSALVGGWRASCARDKLARARLFDREVADALTLALQGDPATAVLLLQQTKGEILEERMSWARFQYLIWACGAGFLLIAIFSMLSSAWFASAIHAFAGPVRMVWSAAGIGCVGAFFSIALGVRTRELRTDLQSSDNAADAVLRVVIGATAAAILVCLLGSGIAAVSIGHEQVGGTALGDPGDWMKLVVVAFLAGFSERLVPNLLEKATLTGMAAQRTVLPAGGGIGGALVAAAESQAAAAAASSPAPAAAPDPADEACDGCVADAEIGVEDETDDTELPPAAGGVADAPAALAPAPHQA